MTKDASFYNKYIIDKKVEPDNLVKPKERSPLSFKQRGTLDIFATEQGKDRFLKENLGFKEIRNINGRKAVQADDGWYFVDPKGFDIGDLADMSQEAMKLSGFLVGASKGAAIGTGLGGPVGGLIGGVVGAGAGGAGTQSLIELLGKASGLRPEVGISDAIENVADETVNNMASELLGLSVLKVAGKTKKFLSSKIEKKFVEKFMQDVWNFTSNVPHEAIQAIQRKGAEFALNPKFQDFSGFVKPLLFKTKRGMNTVKNVANAKYGDFVKPDTGKTISIKPIVENLKKEILTPDVTGTSVARELVKDGVSKILPNRAITGSAAPNRVLVEFYNNLNNLAKKPVKLEAVRSLRKVLDDNLINWQQQGLFTTKTNPIVKSIRKDLSSALHNNSILYKEADEMYSSIANIAGEFKTKSKTSALAGHVEKFMNDYFKLPEVQKEALWKINKFLPEDQRFMEDLFGYATSNAWHKGGFQAIRAGSMGTLATLGLGAFGGPVGLAAGLTISTPKLLIRALNLADKSIGITKPFVKKASKGVGFASKGLPAAFRSIKGFNTKSEKQERVQALKEQMEERLQKIKR